MTSLKTLTFKTIERNRRESQITARRRKLIVKLEEQQKVLEHYMKGEQYVVTGPKWMRNNHGERVLVQKQRVIRPWFFERDIPCHCRWLRENRRLLTDRRSLRSRTNNAATRRFALTRRLSAEL